MNLDAAMKLCVRNEGGVMQRASMGFFDDDLPIPLLSFSSHLFLRL